MTDARQPGTVELYFTDRDGVRWRVYEFGIVRGEAIPYPIGTVAGLYRGFVRVDAPTVRRVVLLATKADYEPARVLSGAELQRELDRSAAR